MKKKKEKLISFFIEKELYNKINKISCNFDYNISATIRYLLHLVVDDVLKNLNEKKDGKNERLREKI